MRVGVSGLTCALGVSLFLSFLPAARGANRWKIQFFYDKPDAAFDIRDLACWSTQNCIGAGAIGDVKGHVKGVTVTTQDSGQHWAVEDFADEPVSLFFLSEKAAGAGTGWMVAQHGIFRTDEGGRSWKKVSALKGIARVHFLDAMHGFAVGYPKAIYETTDGGTTWTKVAAAQTLPGRPESIIYDCITFDGPRGVILGRLATEQYQRYPIWLIPNAERIRQQRESATLTLQTFDGGKNWKAFSGAFVGNIAELQFAKDDQVLALVEYRDMYSLPSAVMRTKLGAPGAQTIFGEKDRAVTDLALLSDGSALIAAVEPPGNTNQVPVPGKLKMLRSDNLKLWEEMEVDYRAEARHATIAAPDAEHVWVATDTGMILMLESKTSAREKHLQ